DLVHRSDGFAHVLSPRGGARPCRGAPDVLGRKSECAFAASSGNSTGGAFRPPCAKHDKVFSARRIIPGKPWDFQEISTDRCGMAGKVPRGREIARSSI